MNPKGPPSSETADAQADSWRRLVLENALDAVVGMGEDQVIIDWNRQAEVVFGWSKQEVIGKHLAEIIIPPNYRDAHYRGIERFLASGEGPILNRRIEVEALHRKGGIFPVELTIIPMRIDGRYLFYSFLRDITERKRSEQILQASEERFRIHFEQAPFSIQVLSPDGRTLAVNKAWKELWCFPEEVVQNYILRDYNVRKDPQLTAKGIMPYIERGFSGEATEIPPILYVPEEIGLKGQPRWVSAFIYPVKDSSGRTIEVVLTHNDVTRAKSAEDELRRSSDQLKVILEGVADGVLVQDMSFRCVYANEVGARMCGFPSAEAFCNASIPELLSRFEIRNEGGQPLAADQLPARKALSGGNAPQDAVIRVRDLATGKETWSVVSSRPIFDPAGKPYLAVSIFRDITAKKLREENQAFLNEATQVLASSLDYNETLRMVARFAVPRLSDWCSIDILEDGGPRSVAVAHQDPGKLEYAEELRTRYPPDWNSPTGSPNVMRTGVPELYSEIPDELLTRAARDAEHLKIIRGLGMKSAMVVPLKSNSGVLGAITFISAESERRYSEAELEMATELGRRAGLALENARLYGTAQQARKEVENLAADLQKAVRARDEFISICSHELKTPVTAMKLQFQVAARQLKKGDPAVLTQQSVEKRTGTALRQLDRMSRLVEEMLDVSRISAGKLEINREPLSLPGLTREVIDHFAEQFAALGIAIEYNSGPGQATVLGDRYRLEQVISNLLTNAVKYGSGKPVQVSVETDGKTARLAVKDQGIGIDQENLERIFDRFERAISASNISGLGLGLYISRQIVEAHRGRIWATSEPGKGSVFSIELPIHAM